MSFRKQTQFAGIARVMARHRDQTIRVRGARYHTAPAVSPPAGAAEPPKLVVLERDGVRIDLNEAITEASFGSDPTTTGKKLSAAIEAIRQQLAQAVNAGWGPEAYAKATKDLETVIAKYDAAVKEYRALLSPPTDQGWGEGKLNKNALGLIQLRYDPQSSIEQSDKVVGPHVMRMSRAYYNILCSSTRDIQAMGCDDPIVLRKIERFQKLHDTVMLQMVWLAKSDPTFHIRGGWQSLPQAEELKALATELGQGIRETRLGPAINETNPDEGKNWVPGPMLSGRILPLIEEEVVFPTVFEHVPMPGATYEIGVQGSHLVSYKLEENISDAGDTTDATILASNFATKKFTFTAKHHAAAAVATPAWLQDAIVQADYILRDLAYAIARGRQKWGLNGQVTSVLDGVTITSRDIRKMGDGVRLWYKQMKTAGIIVDIDMSAGVTAEGVVKMMAQQKGYGNRPRRAVFFANTGTFMQLLVLKSSSGGQVVLTEDVTGGRGTFRTGSLGQMYGRDIMTIDEEDLASTMDATGIVPAAPGDRSVLLHVFTDACKFGNRLGISVDRSTDFRFLQYQEVFRAVARDDFQKAYDTSTQPFISQGVGIRKV